MENKDFKREGKGRRERRREGREEDRDRQTARGEWVST